MSEHARQSVSRLADSLDGVLASCEDLLAEPIRSMQHFRLELAAITHALQARRCIDDLEVTDPALLDQCALFLAGTAALSLERLRSISPASRSALATEAISDSYLVAHVMPLGNLAHFAAAMLDALEAQFVLYDETCRLPKQ
jgi:hypothetical protein